MDVISPRSGAAFTSATGVIVFPSNVATPSSVPIQSVPSVLCASATADDCGNPRQLDFGNVRNARVGVHSSAPSDSAAKTMHIARRGRGAGMGF